MMQPVAIMLGQVLTASARSDPARQIFVVLLARSSSDPLLLDEMLSLLLSRLSPPASPRSSKNHHVGAPPLF